MHLYMGFGTDMGYQISKFFSENVALITLRDTKVCQNFTELK
jgi:hypothetical protein